MSNNPHIVIAGCGPGHPDYLTAAVHKAVAGAELLVGAPHLLELFPEATAARIPVGGDIPALLRQLEKQLPRQMVVLVSGDTGLFSLARSIQAHFGAEQCRLIPGVSSVQVACARLGLDWNDLRIVSAHGRQPELAADELRSWRKIAVLAGTTRANLWAAELLDQLGGGYAAVACENLTRDDERIRQLDAAGLRNGEPVSRTIILLFDRELLS